ncbi:MAG: hypothetical protein ABWY94_02525 [Pseudoxanthomonas sp.]
MPDDRLLADYYFLALELPAGMELETRLDADLNGDRLTDIAFVARNEDRRVLGVLLGYLAEVDMGHTPNGKAELAIGALGPASLTAPKGVLVVEDLTGGTTATAATYRYRYDGKQERMRLIGLDAQRYSRTNSHDSLKLSWNLLDGTHIVERGALNRSGQGDEAYFYSAPEKTMHKTQPVWMENTPNPDDLIDAEVVPSGEDRD